MSEKEFWEDDPQLYWAYHILFKKKEEIKTKEKQYEMWLQGKMNYIAYSCTLRDAFSKDDAKGFPSFDEIFNNSKIDEDNNMDKESIYSKQMAYWSRL